MNLSIRVILVNSMETNVCIFGADVYRNKTIGSFNNLKSMLKLGNFITCVIHTEKALCILTSWGGYSCFFSKSTSSRAFEKFKMIKNGTLNFTVGLKLFGNNRTILFANIFSRIRCWTTFNPFNYL